MSLIKYQNQYQKLWNILKEIKFCQKNDTQKSGNSQEMTPKNLEIAQKRYPKIREQPRKRTQKMAHPHITTYAS